VDGHLFCQPTEGGPLIPHSLDSDRGRCSVVKPLQGHTHGPECGHELVPHGDHFDFLVRVWCILLLLIVEIVWNHPCRAEKARR
jgi:hypothetical protein